VAKGLKTGGSLNSCNVRGNELDFIVQCRHKLLLRRHAVAEHGVEHVHRQLLFGDCIQGYGINGGFFNSSCGSLDLVKTNGVLHSTNEMTGYEQPTIGWNDGAPAQFSWIFPGQDFSGVNNGIGGFPSLVEASVPFAAVYPGEQVWSSGDWQPNPRSAMGFKNGHTMMFWTLDGRTDMGDGLSTPALAEALASWGAEYAMGLDGGGSTTLYIRDCSINSVVNFPSDNQKTDHKGMRSVSDGVYVR